MKPSLIILPSADRQLEQGPGWRKDNAQRLRKKSVRTKTPPVLHGVQHLL